MRTSSRRSALQPAPAALPSVVIVGRPNVGKSTLFNRLTRSRRAIVGDEPGITRDRLMGVAEWRGRSFQLTDTGGMLPGEEAEIPAAIFQQAQVALAGAAVVLMVVDGRSELAAPDLELARLLRTSGKPLLLVVNKMESERQAADLGPFYRLGIADLFPVSAEHGQGLEDALNAVVAALPVAGPGGPPASAEASETRIAIVGRPNVGKSTLLNRLLGENRSIVSPVAGTTRDAVDALVRRGALRWRMIDTAGIRRKGVTRLLAEKLSVVMARKHLEQADVALIVLDGAEPDEEGVLSLDATIAGYAVEALRTCVIVVNKWDRAKQLGRSQEVYKRRVRERLKFLAFAPIVFISAQEGAGMPKLEATIGRVARERHKRVPTAALNRFLASVDFTRAPTPIGQRVRILYLSQVSTAPPQFVLFLDRARPLHFAYRRFLENQLRQAFGFEGTPLLLKTRIGKQTPARGR
ncbi:MAG TPA: ribosome biogenesis GTPase Der [Terriglobales bacterium]|nr:ribosome biogenesis GTPase Der [Terriglobales bacterium]